MNWSLVITWKFFIQAHPLTSRVNNEVLKGGVTMKVEPLVQHYFHMMLLAFLQFTNEICIFLFEFSLWPFVGEKG